MVACGGTLTLLRKEAAASSEKSPEEGRAIEILGHAIEYLADEYCADAEPKGRLGNADPRIEAIQTLKALNRSIYYSAAEVEPAFTRMKRWVLSTPTP